MSDLTPKLMGNDPKNEGFDPKIKEKRPQSMEFPPYLWGFCKTGEGAQILGSFWKFSGLLKLYVSCS